MEIVRELPLDQVLLGDSVRMMRMLPPASVHCVFADPPYNLQLRGELRRPDDSLVDGVDDDWDRFEDFESYDRFTREWLRSKANTIEGGTSEVNVNVVAKRVLGLPDPK